jgi:hypothetical protein
MLNNKLYKVLYPTFEEDVAHGIATFRHFVRLSTELLDLLSKHILSFT